MVYCISVHDIIIILISTSILINIQMHEQEIKTFDNKNKERRKK